MNWMIKSLRNLSNLIDLSNQFRSKKPMMTNTFIYKAFRDYVQFYVDIKWIKASTHKEEIFLLINALNYLNKNKKNIFIDMIEKTKGMKEYLVIHSAFDEEDDPKYDVDNKDWVVELFRDYLLKCEEPKKQVVPDEYIKCLEMFDVRPVEYDMDDNIIKYGLWKRLENGRIRDPIYICNKAWEDIHGVKSIDVIRILNKVPTIDLLEDLPF